MYQYSESRSVYFWASRIRIQIRESELRLQGSGSVPKCHGSPTLLFWRLDLRNLCTLAFGRQNLTKEKMLSIKKSSIRWTKTLATNDRANLALKHHIRYTTGTTGPTCAYPAVPGFWPCKCIQLQDRRILEQSAQSFRAKHIIKS